MSREIGLGIVLALVAGLCSYLAPTMTVDLAFVPMSIDVTPLILFLGGMGAILLVLGIIFSIVEAAKPLQTMFVRMGIAMLAGALGISMLTAMFPESIGSAFGYTLKIADYYLPMDLTDIAFQADSFALGLFLFAMSLLFYVIIPLAAGYVVYRLFGWNLVATMIVAFAALIFWCLPALLAPFLLASSLVAWVIWMVAYFCGMYAAAYGIPFIQ